MFLHGFLESFDTVPHRRLVGKLDSYGIRKEVLRWVESFLNDRRQKSGSKWRIQRVDGCN